jgi:prepilin signal peptidase PulO-like enzyme (type II secretory pathway)
MNTIESRWIDLALFIAVLIPISIVDIKTRKIPDFLIIIGLVIFLVTKALLFKELSFWLILDTAVGFMSIFCLWFFTKGGIGLGDAKLSGLLGFVLGVYFWIIALLIASLAGLLTGVVLLAQKKMERQQGIPFAPFLAIGGIISYILKYFIMKDMAGIWQSLFMFRN